MVKKPYKSIQVRKQEAEYVQRAKALRVLGVSLADFRKLCILKGVFPRIPKRKLQGRDKVYYHSKDVKHLAHDPLLTTLRREKVATKRIHKALAKNEVERARTIAKREVGEADVSHIIRERYPSLLHALRDMDDALCLVALFAVLPTDNKHGITGEVIAECKQLMEEWMALIAEVGCLDKVFATIKGYYLQATVLGEKIIWLMPHEFAVPKSEDVDAKVMATFLLLYRNLLKFVNFKLYKMAQLQYPPKKVIASPNAAGGWLNLKMKRLHDSNEVVEDLEDQLSFRSLDAVAQKRRKLFKQQVFYINRENHIPIIAFCARACGAKLCGFDETIMENWTALSPLTLGDGRITHYVSDRPEQAQAALVARIINASTRIFVQPQWLFDSINMNELLPTTPYQPGVAPPSHLSPFVDDEAEGYIPEQRRVLAQWAGHAADTLPIKSDDSQLQEDYGNFEHEAVAAIVEQFQNKGQRAGVSPAFNVDSPAVTEKTKDGTSRVTSADKLREIGEKKARKEKEDELERRKTALTRKKRVLVQQIEKRKHANAKVIKSLETKRMQAKQ